jgi:hypothetical protein
MIALRVVLCVVVCAWSAGVAEAGRMSMRNGSPSTIVWDGSGDVVTSNFPYGEVRILADLGAPTARGIFVHEQQTILDPFANFNPTQTVYVALLLQLPDGRPAACLGSSPPSACARIRTLRDFLDSTECTFNYSQCWNQYGWAENGGCAGITEDDCRNKAGAALGVYFFLVQDGQGYWKLNDTAATQLQQFFDQGLVDPTRVAVSLAVSIDGFDVGGGAEIVDFTVGNLRPTGPTFQTGSTPAFSWTRADGAVWYQLWVNDAQGNKVNEWYRFDTANCGSGVCSIAPGPALADGWAQFWVRAAGNGWVGPWMPSPRFVVQAPPILNARVLSLYPVTGATAGGATTLWAYVENTGNTRMPAVATVNFLVSGPGGIGGNVGSASVAGLSPGTPTWVAFNWTVPGAGGAYSYQAQVTWQTGASPLSGPLAFDVTGPSAQVLALFRVTPSPSPGDTRTLWAHVRNTGTAPLPAGTQVWFFINRPTGGGEWAGSTVVSGLAAGASNWYALSWTIPAHYSLGQYSYVARVYRTGAGAISEWSAAQAFDVCNVCLGEVHK